MARTKQQTKFAKAARAARETCLLNIQRGSVAKSKLRGTFNSCMRREMKKAL